MNRQERILVTQLVHILEAFKNTNGAMPLQHALSFLHI